MSFKQTFSNIYNNNYNKIKRSFDFDLKTNTNILTTTNIIDNDNNTDFQCNDADPNLKNTHDQQKSSYRNTKRYSSLTRNRSNNNHFQSSKELKSILPNDSDKDLKTYSNNFCTPSKKPKYFIVDTTKEEETNDNPFISPPSSAIKCNYFFFNKEHAFSSSSSSSSSYKNRILIEDFQSLKTKRQILTSHQIFNIPEILDNIISFIAINEDGLKLERPYKQRPPESFKHALLIYKDNEKAKQIWESTKKNDQQLNFSKDCQLNGSLFNCLMVNKLWFEITLPYLLKNLIFKDSTRFNKFIDMFGNNNNNNLNIQRLIFNRVSNSKKIHRHTISNMNWLKSVVELKIHISPEFILPTNCFHNFNNLQILSITGNKIINDTYIINISPFLKKLSSFDLRACENVTDIGVVAIALNCQNLQSINLGRHHNGDKITDVALVALGKYTNVETIGLAGCSITDNGLWEFAKWNGDNVKRLSLNNCKLLTDYSIPYLLGFNYFPDLCVLEIRFLDNIKDVRFIVKFKLWKKFKRSPLLIESCERISELIDKEEKHLMKHSAKLSLIEMTTWVNEDDENNDYSNINCN